ncbi:hypothetical protein [Sporobacter termitidis]|uniref:hypothetical protein n=1 Tax=Sporobacter termitidis TaxID=44749 RepID=UPI001160AAED|nr:hypothetical protein [Sporobacter termitidis]
MPREKEGYRDQLADISAFFGERRLLMISDVIRYLGRDRDYVIKRLGISHPKDGITTVELARRLCL